MFFWIKAFRYSGFKLFSYTILLYYKQINYTHKNSRGVLSKKIGLQ